MQTTPEDAQGGPEEDLIEAVLLASRALVAAAARSLGAAPHDVTLPQYRALVFLCSAGPCSAADLGADLDASPSSITRLCDRLERKGLATRQRDPDDGRQVRIAATAAGRDLVDRVTVARRRELRRLVRTVPEEDRAPLAAALRRLAHASGVPPEQAWSTGWHR
jgi:DNA-binding MarR family transcriptional regulator